VKLEKTLGNLEKAQETSQKHTPQASKA